MRYQGSYLRDFVQYGVRDKGSYYHFDNGKVSDKQLRRMILRGHLEKGWTTMYFYDKKGNIDQNLTARANNMIASFANSKNPKLAAIGQSGLKVSSSPMAELEPFHKGNPVKWLEKEMGKIGAKWSSAKQEWANSGLPIPLLNSDKGGGAAALVK